MSPLDDLGVYFDDEGEDAALDGCPVRVLYGAPGSTALSMGGVGLSIDKPRVLIQAASIPPRITSPDADPVLELPPCPGRAQRMRVVETVLDGTGMATLILAAHPD
jgi:hypothetical protein